MAIKSTIASLDFGCAINAISPSPDGQFVAVGGREVFRIVRIGVDSLVEKRNLRQGRINLNYSANDVVWHPFESHSHKVATAATNGAVVVWNVEREGQQKQERIFSHTRTANKVTWSPTDPESLLSGAQDGNVKMWDCRQAPETACLQTFLCKSSVRDVEFAPHNPYTFAAAFDDGNVQIWDIRNSNTYERQITAHQGLTFNVKWHPEDKTLLASGGRDCKIKVWSLAGPTVRPVNQIQTIASVSRISWRPTLHKSHHIVSTAVVTDFNIHVWDVTRPYIPVASLRGHRDVATGLVWDRNSSNYVDQTQDRLLTSSKDGTLLLHDVEKAHHPYEQLPTVALSWSVCDGLASLSDKINRNVHVEPMLGVSRSQSFHNLPQAHLAGQAGALGFSRSSSSSSLVQMFAGKRLATPAAIPEVSQPNAGEATPRIVHLSDKSATVGPAAKTFVNLAKEYVKDGLKAGVEAAFEANGDLAEKYGHNETARVWRILSVIFQDSGGGGAGLEQERVKRRPGTPDSDLTAGDGFQLGDGISDFSESHVTESERTAALSNEVEDGDFLPYFTRPSNAHSFPKASVASIDSLAGAEAGGAACVTLDPAQPTIELLDHSAEAGDIQLIVVVLLILGTRITGQIEVWRRREWLAQYIDQLQRLQLYTEATEVIILSGDDELRKANQASGAHLTCSSCLKPIEGDGKGRPSQCTNPKCGKQMQPCTICRMPVRGLYVWCQGCGHGGHLHHMQQWFAKTALCPSGCGHLCNFHSTK